MHDRITVTVHDDHLERIEELADKLRAAGMQVDQVLPAVGAITGSATESARPVIAALPGVAAVEDEHRFRAPPPDSDIQ